MIDKAEIVGYSTTAFETLLAASQANELLQVIQIALSIIAFIVTISYTIYKWYKRATNSNSDGGSKITKDEVKDLIKDLKDLNKEDEEHGDNS